MPLLQINVLDLNAQAAKEKAELVQKIANNMTLEAIRILAEKSTKPGMSEKLIKFKNMI